MSRDIVVPGKPMKHAFSGRKSIFDLSARARLASRSIIARLWSIELVEHICAIEIRTDDDDADGDGDDEAGVGDGMLGMRHCRRPECDTRFFKFSRFQA